MSLWSMISTKLKEIMHKMVGSKTIEQTLHVSPIISSQMETAITLWSDMYKGKASWIKEPSAMDPVRIVSLGLPALIASEKARTALIEFQSDITTPTKEVEVKNPNYKEPEPDEYGNLIPSMEPATIKQEKPVGSVERAEYLDTQYKKLKKQLRKQVEYGIAKGGIVCKPFLVNQKPVSSTSDSNTKDSNSTPQNKTRSQSQQWQIEFDFIQADAFYPLAFDASGNITEAAFIQTQVDKEFVYRRLEYHKFQNNTVKIINKAYKSTNTQTQGDMSGVDLGQEVSLKEVPQWKDLAPEVTIKDVVQPLFAYFKMPEANTIDTSSPLGVSGYSRAVDLIKDADMQYSRLLWEYEAGEMAIDIDRDALNFTETDANGNTSSHRPVLNSMQQRLYRKVDLGNEGDTFLPYAPSLRDANFQSGLNMILMRIEDATSLSRGTIADVTSEAKTATELKILKQRSYQANADIQSALEDWLKEIIYIMNAYCSLYKITPEGDYDVNFEWDDSIIVDIDTELNKRMTLMREGIMSKLELREWYFGETERQAEEALQQAGQEGINDMEKDLIMGSNNNPDNKELFPKKKKPDNNNFKQKKQEE